VIALEMKSILEGALVGKLVELKSITRVEGMAMALEDRRREERDRMTRRVLLNV
jgi:hypothetical protein